MPSESEQGSSAPVFSVIVPAFNAGRGSMEAFRSLAGQRFNEPFEVIVVDSGPHALTGRLERNFPEFRIVGSERRLGPGEARNAGLRASRGRYVAFCSVDTPPARSWLAERYQVHLAGFSVVGGSVSNGTPRNLVGTAGYLLEYSALVPAFEILQRQAVPHALSFERSILDELGPYPEDVLTGEDTIVNERCVRAEIEIGFAPGASIAHRNLTSVGAMLRHAFRHGRGLAQCMSRYGHGVASPKGSSPLRGAFDVLIAYPVRGLLDKWRRLHGCSRLRLQLALLSPLILLASVATGAGVLFERAQPVPNK